MKKEKMLEELERKIKEVKKDYVNNGWRTGYLEALKDMKKWLNNQL
jgi:hypothetical protein